jgi:hypothetical protein
MKPDEKEDPEFQAYLEHHRMMRRLGEAAQAVAQEVEKQLEHSLAPLQQFADRFVRAREVAQEEVAAAVDSAHAEVQAAPAAVGEPTEAAPDTLKSPAAVPPGRPDVAREQSLRNPRPELLAGKSLLRVRFASLVLGKAERTVRRLVEEGKLTRSGKATPMLIKADSVLHYLGIKNTAESGQPTP